MAPFVGFLQHWRAQGKGAGPRWLFFGCRNPEKDYIYRFVGVCVCGRVCLVYGVCVSVMDWKQDYESRLLRIVCVSRK